MKRFIVKLLFVFIIPTIFAFHLFSWILDIPPRIAIKKGVHKKSLKWNKIKNPKNKYDYIILGSSRGYCAYNPIIIDSIVGYKTFNMCTGSQNVIETYYILNEILKYQKPKAIIYEIYLPSFTDAPDFYHIISNASFMSRKGKYDMIVNGYKEDGLINLINPLLKHKAYLKSDIKNLFSLKSSNKENGYWIQGYFHNNKVVDSIVADSFGALKSEINNSNIKFIEENLKLIMKKCLDNNIELICTRAPYPNTRLNKTSKDITSEFFEGFLKKNNISFFDFNYYDKNENYDYSNFSDNHHMNDKGATKVSKKLANILKERTNKNVSFQFFDPTEFNQKISQRTDINTAQELIKIYYNYSENVGVPQLTFDSKKIENGFFETTLIHDGQQDDSVRATKIIMIAELKNKKWSVKEKKTNRKCYDGRGHNNWSAERCN